MPLIRHIITAYRTVHCVMLNYSNPITFYLYKHRINLYNGYAKPI